MFKHILSTDLEMYLFALLFLASNINLLPLFGTRTPEVLAEERKVTSYVPWKLIGNLRRNLQVALNILWTSKQSDGASQAEFLSSSGGATVIFAVPSPSWSV